MANIVLSLLCFFVAATALALVLPTSHGQNLVPNFYDTVCSEALIMSTVREVVQKAIQNETRMGASLLRLHFHDCFVNGCDGSNLLDDTANLKGEKTAFPNLNSLRGFNVIDDIKAAVDKACNGSVVSCADILTIAARDSVNILGGPWWPVLLGRRDSLNASYNDANNDLPAPFFNFSSLLVSFQSHGMNVKDLVALSGGHSIGLARCATYSTRIYNDTDIDQIYASVLKWKCPFNSAGPAGNNTAPLDLTTARFDTAYYLGLRFSKGLGLLHSDQELYRPGTNNESAYLVELYSKNKTAFFQDFAASMIKMGNLTTLTGSNGQIRLNCRKVN